MLRIKTLVILLLTLFATQVFADSTASYNSQTGVLHIPKVKITGDTSRNSYRVDLLNNGSWNFALTDATNYLDSPVTLKGLHISGGTQVSEGGILALSALALWSDETWSDVTQEATWSSRSSAVTSVVNGQVQAGQISRDQAYASIEASYVDGSTPVQASHSIVIDKSFSSCAYFYIADLDEPSGSASPLRNNDVDGFNFEFGLDYLNIASIIIGEFTYQDYRDAKNYYEYAQLIQNELEAGISSGYYPELSSIEVYVDTVNTDSIYNIYGEQIQIPAIVLRVVEKYFSYIGFNSDMGAGNRNIYTYSTIEECD